MQGNSLACCTKQQPVLSKELVHASLRYLVLLSVVQAGKVWAMYAVLSVRGIGLC
jgi:hypothetical protein